MKLAALALLAIGCGPPSGPVAAPLRPPVVGAKAEVQVVVPQPDCPRWEPEAAPPPVEVTPGDRARSEKGMWRAQQEAFRYFRSEARAAAADSLVQDAVRTLKTDPYAARATALMAAIYVMAGRKQCVRNLIPRLVALRNHPTLGPAAGAIIEQVLRNETIDEYIRDSELREVLP